MTAGVATIVAFAAFGLPAQAAAGGRPDATVPTSPQPTSRADANAGGANGQCPGGPYCSTRDGSASQNGSGKGKAVGRPCAACVGKADNKNPHGQLPDGSDPNAGYECDRNQGVGKSNPAHTGCRAALAPTPTGTPTSTPSGPVTPSVSPTVLGTEATAPRTPAVVAPAAKLPATGASFDAPIALGAGLVLLAIGMGTLLGGRRGRHSY